MTRRQLTPPAPVTGFADGPAWPEPAAAPPPVPPDAVTCPACWSETEDPANLRYRHPFTQCAECGPRYSVVRSLPWTRAHTAMACFPPCADCAREHGDPENRRHGAALLSCPRCGPRLWLADAAGTIVDKSGSALATAREALGRGRIVALKGLGGFELLCRADDDDAVRRLRQRRAQASRPFAVLCADLGVARRVVVLGADEEALLTSTSGPIVLAPRRPDAPVCSAVAPGLGDLGVLLPPTPLHRLLLDAALLPVLVMSPGSRREEPPCVGNREALVRLRGIVDLSLLHDRDIVRRSAHSVVRTHPGGPMLVRRSRGLVPGAVALPVPAPEPVLALGAHRQTTACVAVGGAAYPSQHVGDLDNELAQGFLEEVAVGLEALLAARPRIVAADLHPDYASTKLAERIAADRGGRVVRCQHQLAHAAAVLGEHDAFPRADERVAAVVLDGSGYGPDGTAWGCEWLLLDGQLRWARLGHGRELEMVGGERAVGEPWRLAVAALVACGQADELPSLPLLRKVPADTLHTVTELARHGGWPRCSSAGRLFEAAGALLGLCAINSYEGEAAWRLEALAATVPPPDPWPEIELDHARVLPHDRLLGAAAWRLLGGESAAVVAAGFLRTFCHLASVLTLLALPHGVRRVALAGGCMVNRLLCRDLTHALADAGIETLLPRVLPPGDGGLSYGQAVLAAVALARGVEPRRVLLD